MFKTTFFAGAALAVLTALPTAAAPVYSVSVYTGNQAADGLHFNYNSSGDYATQVSGQAAWYDASTGTATQLGTLGGSSSGGRGISDNGKVAGWSYLPGNSAYHAFLWEGGALQDLGTLGGANSHGYAVNDSGQVVGYSYITGNSVWHAFLWEDGTITDLGTLGGDLSYAYDINNAGQVVGQSLIAGDSAWHAVLWDEGTLFDLNDLLDASGDGWLLLEATGINHDGLIYGYGFDPQGLARNFLLTPVIPDDTGNSVPEPAALALFGLGIAGLGLVRRRRMA